MAGFPLADAFGAPCTSITARVAYARDRQDSPVDHSGCNMIDRGQIENVVQLVLEAAPGARVIVFGSHARGDAGPDSDLDLLVIEPEVRARRREMVRLTDVLRPLRIPVDVIVVSSKTFDDWADTPGTVIYEAAREGRMYSEVA